MCFAYPFDLAHGVRVAGSLVIAQRADPAVPYNFRRSLGLWGYGFVNPFLTGRRGRRPLQICNSYVFSNI